MNAEEPALNGVSRRPTNSVPEVYAPPQTTLSRIVHAISTVVPGIEAITMAIIACAIVANRFVGSDPFWILIVAASSEGKSEMLRAFSSCMRITMLSSLTSKTLLSGAYTSGKNASLLPELSDHVLILKDFTTILEMRREERAEVFAQLREVFDGEMAKAFGTGERVSWQGKVGLIAGVTPMIDAQHAAQATLGLRFLVHRPSPVDRHAIAMRALDAAPEADTRHNVAESLAEIFDSLTDIRLDTVALSASSKEDIALLADIATRGRTHVDRDGVSREVTHPPAIEGTPRLAKQLRQLAAAHARLCDRNYVNEEDVDIVERVAFDTMTPPLRATILREAIRSPVTLETVKEITKLSGTTVRRTIEDLCLLGLLDEEVPNARITRCVPSALVRKLFPIVS